MKQKLIYIFGFGLVFLLVSIVNIFISEPVFNSPDEASNYQVVKEYGTTGKLYLEGDYLDIDYGNNLHPRGFITYNNKIVPFNFLGTPLFYGIFYTYFQNNIRYINIIFIFMVIVFLYKITELFGILNKQLFGLIFIGILGCLPLLYFFNFPYLNIVPFVSFVVPFIYYVFKFNRTNNIKYLYIGLFFSFIAIWMRYEQVIFILLFLLINLFTNFKIYVYKRNVFLHFLFITILSSVVFLIPLLILNNGLYGSPLIYGYSLFTKTFFAEERTGNILSSIVNIFFPSQKFDLNVLWINLKNNLFLISFVFYSLGYLELLRVKNIVKYYPYLLLLVYIILYMGMGATYGSGINTISLNKSVNRYWILIHIFFIPLVVFSIRKMNKYKIFIIFFLGTFPLFIFFKTVDQQILTLNKNIEINNNLKINGITNTYIITPLGGKYLYNNNKIISWWGGLVDSNYHFNKTKDDIIKTIKSLLKNGEDIYAFEQLLFSKKEHFKVFNTQGIGFILLDKNLYKLYLEDDYEINKY